MKLTYDPEADALYITLKGHGVDHTVRLGADIAIDYGSDGEIHGIEILAARKHIGMSSKNPEVILERVRAVAA